MVSRFDQLTELAAQSLRAPIAELSLLEGGRCETTSGYGWSSPDEAGGGDIFATHIVGANASLTIADATADPRFAGEPIVFGARRIRFCAGHPVRSRDGLPIGALCLFDLRARQLDDDEARSLVALAGQAGALLELRDAQKALSEQAQASSVFDRFFQLSLEPFCTVDRSMRFVTLNSAWTSLLGWTLDELRGREFAEFLHPDDLEATVRLAGRLFDGSGSASDFTNRYRHRDGHYVHLSWSGRAHDGLVFATARDLTAIREREAMFEQRDAALSESAERMRTVLDAMAEGVFLQLATGEIAASNAAASQILGLTEDQMIGRSPFNLGGAMIREDGTPFPEAERPGRVALSTGQPQSDVVLGIKKADAVNWFAINSRPLFHEGEAKPYGVVSSFRNVTDKRNAAARAERLARQERLVTVGTLAAGVGHEINNPLSYLLSNLEHAIDELRGLSGDASAGALRNVIDVLTEARSGAENVRRIVRGLRALARSDDELTPTDIAQAVETAVNMTMHELRAKATLELKLPALPQVSTNDSRLTQVLVNLLVNAAQAFPDNDPEHNRIVVRGEVSSEHVSLFVVDNGPGILPEALPRVFDPFFTTKAVGEGRGLGLSVSHSIMRSLKGELNCRSTPGSGAEFEVRLPLAAAAPARRASEAPAPASASLRGRVLIIDDNQSVLRSQVRGLSKHHEVVGESDPRDALRRFESGERYDVVFCDMMMPYLGGPDLYEYVFELDAAQARRFVFITGGVTQSGFAEFLAEVDNLRLEKPVSSQTFRAVVQRLLETPTS